MQWLSYYAAALLASYQCSPVAPDLAGMYFLLHLVPECPVVPPQYVCWVWQLLLL